MQECKREMCVRACACETCPMAKTPSRQPITRCLIDKACVLWIVSAWGNHKWNLLHSVFKRCYPSGPLSSDIPKLRPFPST